MKNALKNPLHQQRRKMLNLVPMKKMVRNPRFFLPNNLIGIYKGNDCGMNIFCPFSAEDEEDTIADQEKVEVNVDHAEELNDLAKEGRLCIYYGFNRRFYLMAVHPLILTFILRRFEISSNFLL